MPLIACPHCSKQCNAPDHTIGESATCPACKKVFTVPVQTQAGASQTLPGKGATVLSPLWKPTALLSAGLALGIVIGVMSAGRPVTIKAEAPILPAVGDSKSGQGPWEERIIGISNNIPSGNELDGLGGDRGFHMNAEYQKYVRDGWTYAGTIVTRGLYATETSIIVIRRPRIQGKQ